MADTVLMVHLAHMSCRARWGCRARWDLAQLGTLRSQAQLMVHLALSWDDTRLQLWASSSSSSCRNCRSSHSSSSSFRQVE
jgi:hypothetical protein